MKRASPPPSMVGAPLPNDLPGPVRWDERRQEPRRVRAARGHRTEAHRGVVNGEQGEFDRGKLSGVVELNEREHSVRRPAAVEARFLARFAELDAEATKTL